MFSFSSPSSPHRDKNFHLSSCNTTMKFKILIFHFAKNVWLLKFCSLTLLGIFSIYLFFLCMYLSIISVHGTIQICLRSVSRLSKVLYIHDYIQKVLELVNNYISNMFQNCKEKNVTTFKALSVSQTPGNTRECICNKSKKEYFIWLISTDL